MNKLFYLITYGFSYKLFKFEFNMRYLETNQIDLGGITFSATVDPVDKINDRVT